MNTEFVKTLNEDLKKLEIALPVMKRESSVSVSDFGAKTTEGFCNMAPFQDALEYCLKHKISRLTIPRGTYHFLNKPEKNAYLCIDGFKDFTLDGDGSELIFHHTVPYISISDSERILVKDIYLDWAWEEHPLSSVGVIEQVDDKGRYIDICFPSCQEVSADMDIRFVCPFDKTRYTPGSSNGFEFRPYKNNFILETQDTDTDSNMQELVRELSNILKPVVKKVSNNVLRIETQDPKWAREHLKEGQCYNIRHYEYDNYAVYMFDSNNLTLKNITIYSCPGSGFVGNGDIHHLHFNGCKIQVKPGTARSISTTVDGLHICNSQGNFIIENCDFSYSGDDCINIHDNSSMGIKYVDNHTLLALRVRKDSVLFEEGYPVELRAPDLSPYNYSSILTKVRYDEEQNTCLLSFTDPLPKNLSTDAVLFNGRFHTDGYIIRNCRFTNNRARAILLQGCNGIVEHNLFENIQGAAIQIETGCESRWSEGKGVKNLIIRKNVIRHCDLNAWQMAVIYMGVYLPGGRTDYPIFQDVLFESNTICDCPRLAFYLSSCKNVIVQNNFIINANQIPMELNCYGSSTMEEPIYHERYEGTIQFAKATDCVDINNFIFSTLKPNAINKKEGKTI